MKELLQQQLRAKQKLRRSLGSLSIEEKLRHLHVMQMNAKLILGSRCTPDMKRFYVWPLPPTGKQENQS